jgi:hypothetical protein
LCQQEQTSAGQQVGMACLLSNAILEWLLMWTSGAYSTGAASTARVLWLPYLHRAPPVCSSCSKMHVCLQLQSHLNCSHCMCGCFVPQVTHLQRVAAVVAAVAAAVACRVRVLTVVQ